LRHLRNQTQCAPCGVTLVGITQDTRVQQVIVGASGYENMRVIKVDGVEVHRCPAMGPAAGHPTTN
jgi:hypothetical protein